MGRKTVCYACCYQFITVFIFYAVVLFRYKSIQKFVDFFVSFLVQILCLHGSHDGPEQYVLKHLFYFYVNFSMKIIERVLNPISRYVAIMNAIFSAQRSMVCTYCLSNCHI